MLIKFCLRFCLWELELSSLIGFIEEWITRIRIVQFNKIQLKAKYAKTDNPTIYKLITNILYYASKSLKLVNSLILRHFARVPLRFINKQFNLNSLNVEAWTKHFRITGNQLSILMISMRFYFNKQPTRIPLRFINEQSNLDSLNIF